ncbi:MAG: sugar ABC transporter permease [Firmicutes bacterium]|jgi:ABC-type sugar transport system permease subunit|nr:sugar ABC transporter permease [Bacillota bacterium]MDH7496388.1 sugar ABC transporter permease [Bacillota bacterium]
MKQVSLTIDKRLAPYVFLLPFLVFFLAFRVGPIVWSLVVSFTKWSGMNEAVFVGFQNYLRVFKDGRFWTATYNTLYFVVVYNAIMITLALLLAVSLDSSLLKGKGFYRSAYFMPITMSLPVVAMVFDLILARGSGLLAVLLQYLGIGLRVRWLSNASLAMWAIILMRVWRGTGYYCAYFLAGLASIPKDVYEAAKVDGASAWTVFTRISLPLLKPMLLFVLIMSTILSFQIFDEPWILTQGGPADATLMLQIYLYQTSFLEGNLGRGCAISYMMTLLMMGASVLYVKRLGERDA